VGEASIRQQGESASSGMSLRLYFHPLSSYCQKVLIALYENDTPFTPRLIDLGNEASRAELTTVWPIGKFPVLRDDAKDRIVPESSIIIEYLDQYYPGRVRFIPTDPEPAWQTRLRDRFYDCYVHLSAQKIVGDRLRSEAARDSHGVAEARERLRSCYDMIDQQMTSSSWAMGDAFGLADCAALPALFYGDKVEPLGETHRHAAAYLERLQARQSVARVLAEAEPYFKFFPQ
jgi:glutathione S-transferase